MHDAPGGSRLRELEERARRAEARLARTEMICRLGTWEWEIGEGRITCSDEAFRIFGHDPQSFEVKPRAYLKLLEPEDRHSMTSLLRTAIDECEGFEFEHEIARGTEKEPLVVFGRVGVEQDDGRVTALYGAIEDVTQRAMSIRSRRRLAQERTAMAEARNSERRARIIANASSILDESLDYAETLKNLAHLVVPDLADFCFIDMLEPEGHLRSIEAAHADPRVGNEARALRLQYPPDPKSSSPLAEALRTGEPILLREVDQEILRKSSRDEEQLEQIQQLGIGSAMILPLVARGQVLGEITFAVGGSERRYDERDLRFAEELARRAALAVDNALLYVAAQTANKAKSDFLTVMSHELRTPLNAVVGYATLLEEQETGDLAEHQRICVNRIRTSAQHLLQLIEEILDYSKLDIGAERVEVQEEVDLVELAREAASLLEAVASAKGLALNLVLPEDPLVLSTDPRKVRQILLNLLGNAVKFTESGYVELRLQPSAERITFEVEDTGVGIAVEDRERIFSPFHRGIERPGVRRPGTGLGLAVADRLTALMGGELSVRSVLGEGTTFTVALPYPPGQ